MNRGSFFTIFLITFLISVTGLAGAGSPTDQSQPPGNNKQERFEFQRAPEIRVSVDSGWQRDGRTPVQVSLPGFYLELSMDERGRVFREDSTRSQQVLFVLNPASGEMRAGETVRTGRVMERNALRTRLRFPATATAILLDMKSGHARLDLGGIAIPLLLRTKTNAAGERELRIGLGNAPERGRWLLDPQEGSLSLQPENPAARGPMRTVRLVRRKAQSR